MSSKVNKKEFNKRAVKFMAVLLINLIVTGYGVYLIYPAISVSLLIPVTLGAFLIELVLFLFLAASFQLLANEARKLSAEREKENPPTIESEG